MSNSNLFTPQPSLHLLSPMTPRVHGHRVRDTSHSPVSISSTTSSNSTGFEDLSKGSSQTDFSPFVSPTSVGSIFGSYTAFGSFPRFDDPSWNGLTDEQFRRHRAAMDAREEQDSLLRPFSPSFARQDDGFDFNFEYEDEVFYAAEAVRARLLREKPTATTHRALSIMDRLDKNGFLKATEEQKPSVTKVATAENDLEDYADDFELGEQDMLEIPMTPRECDVAENFSFQESVVQSDVEAAIGSAIQDAEILEQDIAIYISPPADDDKNVLAPPKSSVSEPSDHSFSVSGLEISSRSPMLGSPLRLEGLTVASASSLPAINHKSQLDFQKLLASSTMSMSTMLALNGPLPPSLLDEAFNFEGMDALASHLDLASTDRPEQGDKLQVLDTNASRPLLGLGFSVSLPSIDLASTALLPTPSNFESLLDDSGSLYALPEAVTEWQVYAKLNEDVPSATVAVGTKISPNPLTHMSSPCLQSDPTGPSVVLGEIILSPPSIEERHDLSSEPCRGWKAVSEESTSLIIPASSSSTWGTDGLSDGDAAEQHLPDGREHMEDGFVNDFEKPARLVVVSGLTVLRLDIPVPSPEMKNIALVVENDSAVDAEAFDDIPECATPPLIIVSSASGTEFQPTFPSVEELVWTPIPLDNLPTIMEEDESALDDLPSVDLEDKLNCGKSEPDLDHLAISPLESFETSYPLLEEGSPINGYPCFNLRKLSIPTSDTSSSHLSCLLDIIDNSPDAPVPVDILSKPTFFADSTLHSLPSIATLASIRHYVPQAPTFSASLSLSTEKVDDTRTAPLSQSAVQEYFLNTVTSSSSLAVTPYELLPSIPSLLTETVASSDGISCIPPSASISSEGDRPLNASKSMEGLGLGLPSELPTFPSQMSTAEGCLDLATLASSRSPSYSPGASSSPCSEPRASSRFSIWRFSFGKRQLSDIPEVRTPSTSPSSPHSPVASPPFLDLSHSQGKGPGPSPNQRDLSPTLSEPPVFAQSSSKSSSSSPWHRFTTAIARFSRSSSSVTPKEHPSSGTTSPAVVEHTADIPCGPEIAKGMASTLAKSKAFKSTPKLPTVTRHFKFLF